MNDLNDIVFNPHTGLFESQSNPTAHLTAQQFRKIRARRPVDPARAAKKPIIVDFRVEGGLRHKVGSEVCIYWHVANAEKVILHFQNRNELEYSLQGSLRIFMPEKNCMIRLLAKNDGVTTQRTITLTSRRKTIFDKIKKWVLKVGSKNSK